MQLIRKKVAILQSNYIPWKGYFDIIAEVDEFIIYDEVQYTKNDWRNRNKIKTSTGVQWITIPVYQRSLDQRIAETKISDSKWAAKHWNAINGSYARAPFFKGVYKDMFQAFYSSVSTPYLSEVNEQLIKLICEFLNVTTVISHSRDYDLDGDPTERLVSLCQQTKANTYVSGPAAKNYLDEALFTQAKIGIEWMDYSNYPEYPQMFPPFEHGISIVDLLFNTGPSAGRYMKFKKS
jgi:hypothetical protein